MLPFQRPILSSLACLAVFGIPLQADSKLTNRTECHICLVSASGSGILATAGAGCVFREAGAAVEFPMESKSAGLPEAIALRPLGRVSQPARIFLEPGGSVVFSHPVDAGAETLEAAYRVHVALPGWDRDWQLQDQEFSVTFTRVKGPEGRVRETLDHQPHPPQGAGPDWLPTFLAFRTLGTAEAALEEVDQGGFGSCAIL